MVGYNGKAIISRELCAEMKPEKAENRSNIKLTQELRSIVGTDAVITEEEALRPFECDGLTAYRELPLMVVLPSTIEEVQRIMKACSENSVPVVTRGAGTGLSGGALPLPDGVFAESHSHE